LNQEKLATASIDYVRLDPSRVVQLSWRPRSGISTGNFGNCSSCDVGAVSFNFGSCIVDNVSFADYLPFGW